MTTVAEFRRTRSTRVFGVLALIGAALTIASTWRATHGAATWLVGVEIAGALLLLWEVAWKWRTPLLSLTPWGVSWSPSMLFAREINFATIEHWQMTSKVLYFVERSGRTVKIDVSDLDEANRARLLTALQAQIGTPPSRPG